MPATAKSPAERRSEADAAIKTIRAKAKSENRRQSAEELDEIETHLEAIEAANADEKADKDLVAREADVLARANKADADLSKSRGRRAAPAASEPATAHEAFLDDPKRGYATPREFLSDVIAFQSGRNRRVKRLDNLKSLFVRDAGDAGPEFLATVGSDEQGGYANPYGGFAVPVGLVPGLRTRGFDPDPFSPRCTPLPMESPIVKVNARTDHDHSSSVSGGLTVSRRPETVAGSASRMQMEQIEYKATSLLGLAYATEELLADSPISFAALLEAGFRDEFGAQLMREHISGTGGAEFEGILVAPATISIAKETAQVAATIVTANILKMRARCWGYANAIWYANQTCIPQLALLTIDVGTGGVPIFQPSLREDVPDMLLGRPIFFGEFAKAVGTVGDIILANCSQCLMGEYEPIQGASSIHVRFVNHEQAFKFWLRNCCRPWWRAALTPANGSTLSPWVTLATRA